MAKSYHHLPCSKKSIFLKKRYGKYFIEAGSWFTHMPPKKKWRETVSDRPNNLVVPWMTGDPSFLPNVHSAVYALVDERKRERMRERERE